MTAPIHPDTAEIAEIAGAHKALVGAERASTVVSAISHGEILPIGTTDMIAEAAPETAMLIGCILVADVPGLLSRTDVPADLKPEQAACHDCQAAIWTSATSRANLVRFPNAVLVCPTCIVRRRDARPGPSKN